MRWPFVRIPYTLEFGRNDLSSRQRGYAVRVLQGPYPNVVSTRNDTRDCVVLGSAIAKSSLNLCIGEWLRHCKGVR